VAATREPGLEVSADKTKYMVMSRDQNAGRIHSVGIDNNTYESRLRSGNACYDSVQNLLSSRLLSKKLKIRYIEL